MEIYSTYVDAVIANGSTKGIYKNRESEKFATPSLVGPFWKNYRVECNPADYLESVADFQARGKLLAVGDDIVDLHGTVITVFDESVQVWNSPSNAHSKRFIIQAAADNTPDTDTTWKPVVGDEVSTCEGIGKVLTTVVRDNLTGYIVQFENDWNEFDLSELKSVNQDYYNGKTVHELWYSCLFDESWYSCLFDELNNPDFNDLTVEARGRWIEFAKLVKRA